MTQPRTNVIPFRKPLEAVHRSEIIGIMAAHLAAGMLNGLNMSSDIDVIQYLLDTPERFHPRIVLDHMDDAPQSAVEIFVAMKKGDT
jgi:hypothetical protein